MVLHQAGMLVGCEKPATVAGSSSSDEAKIGGMTPEVLSFSGRCEVSPWNMRLPTWRFGYWISSRRWARSKNTMSAMTTTASTMIARIRPVDSAPVRPSSSVPDDGVRQVGDDAGEDDQRNAVADAARGDLLAEPHQEHGAADQRDDGRDAEEQPGIDDDALAALQPDRDAIGLDGASSTVP